MTTSAQHRDALRYANVPVLVLGASGFIGRWVARRLSATGARVTCAVRDVAAMQTVCSDYDIRAEIRPIDLRDSVALHDLVAELRPSVTFNLAGYGVDRSERDDALAWRINADLVGELGELTERYVGSDWRGQCLVHTGSALEYGTIGGHLPENAEPHPETLYGQTKLAGTRTLLAGPFRRTVTARLFTVFGAGEHAGRLLPTLLAASRHGQPVPLSAGVQRRDFTYVEDVAEGLLRLGLLEAVPGGVVNVATGKLYSVREFAELAARVLHIPADRLEFGALPQLADEMPHETVSVERLRESIAWVPETSIADGVLRTAQFLGVISA